MPEVTNEPNFIPYDSPEYERDAAGNIKIYDPESEPNRCEITGNICGTDTWLLGCPCKCKNCQKLVIATVRYSPPEPSIVELKEIKDLLKQILNKLR